MILHRCKQFATASVCYRFRLLLVPPNITNKEVVLTLRKKINLATSHRIQESRTATVDSCFVLMVERVSTV